MLAEERAAQRDREVAHRAGERLIPALEPVDFTRSPVLPPPFETGGVYLLAGGLGGMGARLAEHLLSQHRARVLVIGRSSLTGLHASPRALVLRELTATAMRSGGEIVYESADATDPQLVGEAVRRAEQRWSRPLAGIVHLASHFEERALADETPESFATALRPKILGARALSSLLTSRPGCLFIAFSSVNSFFGGLSASAYAAASRSLEHFVHELRRAGHPRAHCLVWSAWDEVGLSRGYRMKEHALARGFHAVSALKGQTSILVALRRSEGSLFIGLDGTRPQVLRHIDDASRSSPLLQQLAACVVSVDGAGDPALSLSLRDRFGAPLSCSVRRVDSIPLRPDGAVDARELLLLGGGSARPAAHYVAPRGEAEAIIAGIWRDALRIDRVGSDDNFFDLGGHSMLLAVVRDKLARAFGRDVPIVEMFRHPTVAALAAHLSRESRERPENPRSGDLDERARKQRAALDQQRRRALPRRKNDV